MRRGGREGGEPPRVRSRARIVARIVAHRNAARELEREQERALLLHRFGEERAQDRKEEDETQRHSREPRGDDAVVPDEIHRRRAGRGGVGRGHARVRRGKRRATRGVALRREPAELASARFSPHRRTVSGGLTTIAGDEMQHRRRDERPLVRDVDHFGADYMSRSHIPLLHALHDGVGRRPPRPAFRFSTRSVRRVGRSRRGAVVARARG